MERADEFEHLGFIYEDEREYLTGAQAFIDAGRASDAPALVAVPGRRIARMLVALGATGAGVEFCNMTLLSRNPSSAPSWRHTAAASSRPAAELATERRSR